MEEKPQKQVSRWHIFTYSADHAGRGPAFIGMIVLLPIFLSFVGWAAFAPLNAAAIASGEIVLSSDRKTVQHLEGGLITNIYVKEGEAVEKGQPLIAVQDLAEQARIQALTLELVNSNALIARLSAERDLSNQPEFSNIANALEIDHETVTEFTHMHNGIFNNLRDSIKSLEELSASRKIQIQREIEGLNAQLIAKRREAFLVKEELENKKILLEKGIATEVEVNALSRTEAVLDGEVGSLVSSIAKLEQSVLDQDVEIVKAKNERASTMFKELHQALVTSENLKQELVTLRDKRNRSIIRSPVKGLVLGKQVHTIGAVISPGTPLMDIIPQDDDLIIEAKVNPTDIDLVSQGMKAKVQLSAFKAKKVDKLDARVETVSGDLLIDEATGEKYFLTRLRVSDDILATLPNDIDLTPGMPSDVFLIAGERTVANYLLSPILDSLYRSFREE